MGKKKTKKVEKGSLISKRVYTLEELDYLELRAKVRQHVKKVNEEQAKLRWEETEKNRKQLKKPAPSSPVMLGNIPIKPENLIWTPELRDKFLAIPRVVGDRDLNVKRMLALRNSIQQARMEFRLAVYFVESIREYRRGNGNTCMNLSCIFPEPFEGATITYYTYTVPDLEAARLCHKIVDNPDGSRNVNEQLEPDAVANGVTLKASVRQGLLSGILFAETGVHQEVKDGYVKDRLAPYRDFVHWYMDLDMPRPYSRAPISAGIYCMWLVDPDDAFVFCNAIKKNDFTDNNIPREPRAMLAHWVAINDAPKNQKGADQLEQFNWIRYAWNCWRNGESSNSRYEKRGPTPTPNKSLEPFDGLTQEYVSRLKITSKLYIPKKKNKK